MILDRFSQASRALIRDYHLAFLHAGPQLLFSALCRKYYIICGKRVIKSVLSACPTCRRYSGRCVSQQMASLPFERLDLEYPFTVTGVDFAGPIKVTPSKSRGIQSTKGYICIFVCFATRATHIEIVSDLSTKAFLAAFDRFCNRHGLPKMVCSDNATNFQGAEREIAAIFAANSESLRTIREYVNNLEISWSFLPPYGPHFGGLWEAAVKSFKYHYKRVLGEPPSLLRNTRR